MKNKVLIVCSNYYDEVSSNLIKGATAELKINNIDFEVVHAPGCFEVPYLISQNLEKYIGFIALGCVIRGETYHFNLIANECARKIMDLSVDKKKPIGFGILTCENLNQAIERSKVMPNTSSKDKGGEAAKAITSILWNPLCLKIDEI